MKASTIAAAFSMLFLGLGLLLLMVGCDQKSIEEEETQAQSLYLMDKVPILLPERFFNDAGQDVFYVTTLKFKTWLNENRNKEIVAITSFCVQNYHNMNPTDGFVIVCKRQPAEQTRLQEIRKKINELQVEEKALSQ